MKLQIAAHHVDVSNTLRDHVERRLQQLTRLFDDESCEAHVVFDAPSETKKRFVVASVRINVPKRGFLVARKKGDDEFKAFDASEKALEHELARWKENNLVGSRFPKKYYVARQLEQTLTPNVERGDGGVFRPETDQMREAAEEDFPPYQGAYDGEPPPAR